ncbi:MAG: hypothetical protein EX271_12865 [Acidimicrobiales bacterium]|nr:hypothetical protein [Hyphomonadaceae bacterium]RZV35498.1 MAG: hypothetical protein EX271_12865 [Acidimicrobiales bacterium]
MGIKTNKIALACALLETCFLAWGPVANAQTTPSELVDLSLEDLLNIDVTSKDKDAKKNKWDIGYSYVQGSFGGYQIGTENVSFDDVLFSPGEIRTNNNFPVVPTYISQHIQTVYVSYSFGKDMAVNLFVPHISQSTEHISSVPGFSDFTLKSSGFGDIGVNLAKLVSVSERSSIKGNVGVRIPTGSINETGDTPRNGSGTDERLPFTMQTGSGTLDLTGSVTYAKNTNAFTYGTTLRTTVRTGMNENGYRLGNSVGASIFGHFNKHYAFQPGVQVYYRHIGRIEGEDASLKVPMAFPYPASITNPLNYGGDKLGLTGMIKSCTDASCKISFNAEYGGALYQNLNGIQPKKRNIFSIGAALKF